LCKLNRFVFIGRSDLKFRKFIPHFLVFWVFAIVLVSLIPYLPQPKAKSAGNLLRFDYLFHVFEFLVLAVLCFLWQREGESDLTLINYLEISLAVVFLAVFTEVIQIWIPGRVFNLVDVAFKVSGFLAGTIVYLLGFRLGFFRGNPAPRSHG